MLITHDMGVIAQMADDVAVMYLGRIIEFAPVAQLFAARAIPIRGRCCVRCPIWTRCRANGWRRSAARCRSPARARWAVRSIRAVPRSSPAAATSRSAAGSARRSRRHLLPPSWRHRGRGRRAHERAGSRRAVQTIPDPRGLLRREIGRVRAVDDVNFTIGRGETLALVGECGCGKTTVARCILRALRPTSGAIRFSPEDGAAIDLAPLSRRALRPLRRHIQLIFQDPYASLNPRMMVGDIIAEPLLVNGVPAAQRQARVLELLDLVGLPAAARTRFPHAFSGGQRQRIGIARALALHPSLVVADEPVSALDVSVQAQIINLLLDLQDRLRLSMLFVAHDLGVVRHVSDRVAVMYVGRIVETAPTTALYSPAAPSLHRSAAGGGAEGRSGAARRGDRAPRRGRRSGQSAARLRVPSALPFRRRSLPHRPPRLARNRTRALERVPPHRGAVASRRGLNNERKRHAIDPDRPDTLFALRRRLRAAAGSVSIRPGRQTGRPEHHHRSRAMAEEIRRGAGAGRTGQGRQAAAGRAARAAGADGAEAAATASANMAAPGGAAFSGPATARTATASAPATSCCSGT